MPVIHAANCDETDMQAQFIVMASLAVGQSNVTVDIILIELLDLPVLHQRLWILEIGLSGFQADGQQ